MTCKVYVYLNHRNFLILIGWYLLDTKDCHKRLETVVNHLQVKECFSSVFTSSMKQLIFIVKYSESTCSWPHWFTVLFPVWCPETRTSLKACVVAGICVIKLFFFDLIRWNYKKINTCVGKYVQYSMKM